MRRWWHRRVVWGLLAGVGLAAAGCDQLERELQRRCDRAEETYRARLEEERTDLRDEEETGEESERPAHFGLTLSNGLLSRLADTVAAPVIAGALEIVSSVHVNGESIEVSTDGDVVDLTLGAHDACETCFRVGVDLGGSVTARIPGLGQRETRLAGGGGLVAPLELAPGDEKTAAVKLDLGQLAEVGASNLDARLPALSEEWRQRLKGPLSSLIERELAQRLGAVTLIEFDGPSFGIEGFELTPVALESDAEHEAVFAGFSANVEALNDESVSGVATVTDLREGQDVALAFQPQMVIHLLSLLIEGGDVSRRYTDDGEASERGGFHVTLDRFRVGSDTAGGEERDPRRMDAAVSSEYAGDAGDVGPGAGDTQMPVGLDFGVHQFGDSGLCFSTTAEMRGGVGVREGNLRAGVDEVRLTGDGVPARVLDLANWTSAQFIRESRTLVDQSLDGDNLSVPGTALSVGPLAVGFRPNTLILRGNTGTGD